MNIEVKIVAPGLEAALNNLAAAMGNRQLQAPSASDVAQFADENMTPEAKTKSDGGKPARSARAKETTPSTPEPETAGDAGAETGTPSDQTAAQSPSDDASGSDIDYAQVKAAVMKVSTTKGRQAAVDLLGEFDAKVGGDLTEDQWGPFLARADEILAG